MGLGLGRLLVLAAAAFTGQWQLFATAALSAHQSRVAKRERRRAIEEYNAQLRDRLEMVEMPTEQPRTLVLGRVRFVEAVLDRWSSGPNAEQLTMIVSFGGWRIDAFEQFYLFDQLVTRDANGWVQEVPYFKANERVYESVSGTFDGSGNGSATLLHAPADGFVRALWTDNDGFPVDVGGPSVTVSGLTATVTGGVAGRSFTLTYSYFRQSPLVRLRPYLGGASQNLGAALAAEYPGKMDATDRWAGSPVVVMDCIYDPDAFPQGRPTLSAVLRGSPVYDPRLDSTVPGGSGSQRLNDPNTWAWSENPALHAYFYALWEFGWSLTPDEVMAPEEVAAEANVCDVATVFTQRKPDGSTTTVTLPRYRCGITIPADADPNTRRQKMDEIMATMAGSDGWDGGVWRFRAGARKAADATLTPAWLATKVRQGGVADTEPVLRGVNAFTREQRINRVTGSCVDPAERWQFLPYPAVQDPVLVAAKGSRAQELSFEAVTHIAHAQHLARITIREAQAGTRMEALCNLHAYRTQLLSVLSVRLPRLGMDDALDKHMEVIGRKWRPQGGIKLQLADISDAIFDPTAELAGRDPAPDSSFRSLTTVETLTPGTVTSGTTALQDGSILTRTRITWTAATGASVRIGGAIEVQYVQLALGFPAGEWPSWEEQGSATEATIPGLLAGQFYLFRVRAVQKLPLVRGEWAYFATHQVASAPLVDTGGLAPGSATQVPTPLKVSSLVVTGRSGTGTSYSNTGRWTPVGTFTWTAEADGIAYINVRATVDYFGAPNLYTDKVYFVATINVDFDNDGTSFTGDRVLHDTTVVSTPSGVSVGLVKSIVDRRTFDAVGGTTYTWPLYAQSFEAPSALTLQDIEFGVELIKR